MDITINLDQDRKRFVAKVEGALAMLDFRELDGDRLDYYRTFVPDDLRHRGIASELVTFALDYARDNGYTVVPSCSFVKDFIDKHDEYADLVSEE